MTDTAPKVDPDNIKVLVNGLEYGGWLEVEVEAGIENSARDFTFKATSKWPGSTDTLSAIKPFDLCQVLIGSDVVVTGYADKFPGSYDANSVSNSVGGRSKTGQLVDCAALNEPGQWRGKKVEFIAAEIAKPYGIKVKCEVDTGAVVHDHQVQPSESAFDSIDSLMQARGLLATDNADGDLVIIKTGVKSAFDALELGKNIWKASWDRDFSQVFSEYRARGQKAGTDKAHGKATNHAKSVLTDDSVKLKRILVMQPSGQHDKDSLVDRTAFEKAQRVAKTKERDYEVQGWRQSNGALWEPNLKVKVVDPVIGSDGEMLIVSVTYIQGAKSRTAKLKVGPLDGYSPHQVEKKK